MIDFKSLRGSIRSLHGELKNIAHKVETLKQKREDIEGAALPPDDFAAMILEAIEQGAQGYKDRLGVDMAGLLHVPESRLSSPGQFQRILTATLGQGTGISVRAGFPVPDGCLSIEAIWFLFGDVLRPKLEKAIATIDGYPNHVGLPRHERPAAIAQLDKEINALEGREAKLLAEADAAGLRPVE